MSDITGYRVGGTIHLIINNQIGFTTAPEFARSSLYCSDVAKTVQAPIFHVNGDDPEACVRVARLAFEYRQRFHKDVVIDMWCYRRHGHNEGDDPSYTQPLMYRAIADHRSVRKLYVESLVKRGDITADEAEQALADFQERLQVALDETRAQAPAAAQGGPPAQAGRRAAADRHRRRPAGRSPTSSSALTAYPEGFTPHPKLAKQFEARAKLFAEGEVEWATAEALAFGSLLREGHSVRLAGEDSRRGTFSQRHAALIDYETGQPWVPLDDVGGDDARFWVYDSLLSEYAALGFEYGYAQTSPETLVLWEAQFGDFINCAQVDRRPVHRRRRGQVGAAQRARAAAARTATTARARSTPRRASSASCWPRPRTTSSSCNATTAAQYFHLLRRQVYTERRTPLIVFTPKEGLRMKQTRSRIDELTTGSFREVLDDPGVGDPEAVERVVFCSGKVAWDAMAERDKREAPVAVIRVEQLYPLPTEQMLDLLRRRYVNAKQLVWLQEEPENMGAWRFIENRTWRVKELGYDMRHVARVESGSPATGSKAIHDQELVDLMDETFA